MGSAPAAPAPNPLLSVAMVFPSRVVLAASAALAVVPGGSLVLHHPAARAIAAPVAIPSYSEPSISPDGSEIAFVSAGDIWTVPSRGGDARLLVSNDADESRPLYSPDGTRVAFVSTRTGNGDIYVLTLATGQLTRITYDDQPAQLDSWSHDGAWLYFSSGRNDISGMSDEYRVHSDGGTPMPVAADRYAAEYWGAPSPDGATLAITARGVSRGQWWRKGHSHLDESEIDLVRDVHGVPSYTPIVAMGAKSGWPMWSQDGASIYYVSDRSGSANLWTQSASANATPRQLTTFTDGRVLWPAIAANGSAIVFERDFGIWRYDVGTHQAAAVPITLRGSPATVGVEHRTFTNGIQQFALSPDGKKVAFVVHGEVFAASSRDGGSATRVTNTPAAEDQIDWAPDSRRIVYTSDRDGPRHLFTYDFATSTETQLTRGTSSDVSPTWSPDGAHIAYTRDAKELRVLDLSSHTDRLLAMASLNRPPFLGRSEMRFSPDSRWIAYTSTAGPRDFANVQVVSVAGGESRPVTFLANTSSSSIAWSHDGTYILVSTGQRTETRQLARVDLIPRTPHFREDQFHDLFREESPRPPSPQTQQQLRRQTPGSPRDTAQPARNDTTSPRLGAPQRYRASVDRDRSPSTSTRFGIGFRCFRSKWMSLTYR